MNYLPHGATDADLIEAAAHNHTEWFMARAVVGNGEVRETRGIRWAISPREATIAFPRIPAARASAALDGIIEEIFSRKPESASCWSLLPTRPRDLGAQVAARGFEWGWQPHWMALDLTADCAASPAPAGLQVTVDDGEWEASDLPYYGPGEGAALRKLAQEQPQRAWHFVARLDGSVVAHSVLFLTTGERGAAGIYNVGVVPEARGNGIGKIISLAPCRHAQALGCSYALLNSAADGLYNSIGFRSLGYGQSWWMQASQLATQPSAEQVAFAVAVGRGDVRALDLLDTSGALTDLDVQLTNGMTPMGLAIRAGKSMSARWLEAHGATLEILHAWDLGWKGRARSLASSPDRLNLRFGARAITPLHEAVWRDDMDLARLLLAAGADLDAKDSEFHSTPLGWARHLGRPATAPLLEAAVAARDQET